jgi:hypothetical protein
MEGMEEGGQALKVNSGGERSPKTVVGSRRKKGIYRWGKIWPLEAARQPVRP